MYCLCPIFSTVKRTCVCLVQGPRPTLGGVVDDSSYNFTCSPSPHATRRNRKKIAESKNVHLYEDAAVEA